jgi:WD40 repeat protein
MANLGNMVRRPLLPSDYTGYADDWIFFSPDTRWTISGPKGGPAARIWNSYTGNLERELTNQFGHITHVAFSKDSAWLALTGRNSEARLFKTDDWTSRALTDQLTGVVRSLFSPDGRLLVLTGPEAGIQILEISSGVVLAQFPAAKGGYISAVISPDSRYLALGGQDNLIWVFDLPKRQSLPSLAGHAAGVWSLAFSPDNRTLASTGDKRVKLWSVETWQEILTLHTDQRTPYRLSFSPDARYLVSHAPFIVWQAPLLAEIDGASPFPSSSAENTLRTR